MNRSHLEEAIQTHLEEIVTNNLISYLREIENVADSSSFYSELVDFCNYLVDPFGDYVKNDIGLLDHNTIRKQDSIHLNSPFEFHKEEIVTLSNPRLALKKSLRIIKAFTFGMDEYLAELWRRVLTSPNYDLERFFNLIVRTKPPGLHFFDILIKKFRNEIQSVYPRYYKQKKLDIIINNFQEKVKLIIDNQIKIDIEKGINPKELVRTEFQKILQPVLTVSEHVIMCYNRILDLLSSKKFTVNITYILRLLYRYWNNCFNRVLLFIDEFLDESFVMIDQLEERIDIIHNSLINQLVTVLDIEKRDLDFLFDLDLNFLLDDIRANPTLQTEFQRFHDGLLLQLKERTLAVYCNLFSSILNEEHETMIVQIEKEKKRCISLLTNLFDEDIPILVCENKEIIPELNVYINGNKAHILSQNEIEKFKESLIRTKDLIDPLLSNNLFNFCFFNSNIQLCTKFLSSIVDFSTDCFSLIWFHLHFIFLEYCDFYTGYIKNNKEFKESCEKLIQHLNSDRKKRNDFVITIMNSDNEIFNEFIGPYITPFLGKQLSVEDFIKMLLDIFPIIYREISLVADKLKNKMAMNLIKTGYKSKYFISKNTLTQDIVNAYKPILQFMHKLKKHRVYVIVPKDCTEKIIEIKIEFTGFTEQINESKFSFKNLTFKRRIKKVISCFYYILTLFPIYFISLLIYIASLGTANFKRMCEIIYQLLFLPFLNLDDIYCKGIIESVFFLNKFSPKNYILMKTHNSVKLSTFFEIDSKKSSKTKFLSQETVKIEKVVENSKRKEFLRVSPYEKKQAVETERKIVVESLWKDFEQENSILYPIQSGSSLLRFKFEVRPLEYQVVWLQILKFVTFVGFYLGAFICFISLSQCFFNIKFVDYILKRDIFLSLIGFFLSLIVLTMSNRRWVINDVLIINPEASIVFPIYSFFFILYLLFIIIGMIFGFLN